MKSFCRSSNRSWGLNKYIILQMESVSKSIQLWHFMFSLLNNIYLVLFIKGRIVLLVWPIYTLFVFRLRQAFIIYRLFKMVASFLYLISINLTWYQSWFYETRLNPKYKFADLTFAKFGISSVSTIILVFCLPFSFCNLVFVFSFWKLVLCFGVIV